MDLATVGAPVVAPSGVSTLAPATSAPVPLVPAGEHPVPAQGQPVIATTLPAPVPHAPPGKKPAVRVAKKGPAPIQGDSCLPGDHAKDGKPCPPDQAAAALAKELADEATARKNAAIPPDAVKATGTAKVKVKDNGEYYLTLAKNDGNRIVALNDRIKAVAPVAGGVDYDVDHDLGTLYVHITPPPNGTIVPFYVVTEKGMTYKILGTVQDVPSVQVILNNSDLQDDNKATVEPGSGPGGRDCD